MSMFGDTKPIPFEVVIMAQEVANFCRAAHTLKLRNPETGLDFDNYRLVVFHYELTTETIGDTPKILKRPCTVFGAMPIARYRELYLDEEGKHKENAKSIAPTLTDLEQFVCLFDFNYNKDDASSFLDPKQLTREHPLEYARKVRGVERMQFLGFQRRLLNDFARKIVTTIFRLDHPTDESTKAVAKSVLDRFMKKE